MTAALLFCPRCGAIATTRTQMHTPICAACKHGRTRKREPRALVTVLASIPADPAFDGLRLIARKHIGRAA